MSISPMVTLAETASEGGANHWAIGGLVFVILLALMAALVMFGAGRDHS